MLVPNESKGCNCTVTVLFDIKLALGCTMYPNWVHSRNNLNILILHFWNILENNFGIQSKKKHHHQKDAEL